MRLSMGLFALGLLILIEPLYPQQPVRTKYWIFFHDKESNDPLLQKPSDLNLSEKAIQRRLKSVSTDPVIDGYDLPVSKNYLDALRALNVPILIQSRWLNAVSAPMNDGEVSVIEKLPFVKSVKPVARAAENNFGACIETTPPADPDYGASFQQDQFINVIAAHRMGYSGKNILIGMMDTGFNLDHIAFQNIHVLDHYDFVDGDTTVTEGTGVKGHNGSHGTQVLSTIAGYDDGRFIGTAFGASYLLARTENDDGVGQKNEEDQWIAGLEWLEQKGADVVSSSVSFFDEFQNASDNYQLSDLNGSTALTTLATNIAFDKGVLVFNSAGNMGDRGAKYLGTPSDGKKMIAVGAVYGDSAVADFSSRGPTADGRKKPDLAAAGFNVTVASPINATAYGIQSGTSLSTPMVAGLAALVLEAHPKWTAKQLFDAIRNTASQAAHPDNLIGYGIPNAVRAINYVSYKYSDIQIQDLVNFPNPANGSVTIRFKSLMTSAFSIRIYDALGRLVATITNNEPVTVNQIVTKTWTEKNTQGMQVSSGVYFYRIAMAGESVTEKILLVK